VEEQFRKILASVLEVDIAKIDSGVSSDTFEAWDSLKQMNLIVALEEEFGIRFEEAESLLLNNYTSILQAIETKMAGK
jgi:acyl carrier protein